MQEHRHTQRSAPCHLYPQKGSHMCCTAGLHGGVGTRTLTVSYPSAATWCDSSTSCAYLSTQVTHVCEVCNPPPSRGRLRTNAKAGGFMEPSMWVAPTGKSSPSLPVRIERHHPRPCIGTIRCGFGEGGERLPAAYPQQSWPHSVENAFAENPTACQQTYNCTFSQNPHFFGFGTLSL